jgi:hypothetical protein
VPIPASASKKFILNLSKYILTDSEEASLMKSSNFSVSNPHSYLDMACAVESVVPKFSQNLGMEFMWKIRSTLEKFKSSRPNMTKGV